MCRRVFERSHGLPGEVHIQANTEQHQERGNRHDDASHLPRLHLLEEQESDIHRDEQDQPNTSPPTQQDPRVQASQCQNGGELPPVVPPDLLVHGVIRLQPHLAVERIVIEDARHCQPPFLNRR